MVIVVLLSVCSAGVRILYDLTGEKYENSVVALILFSVSGFIIMHIADQTESFFRQQREVTAINVALFQIVIGRKQKPNRSANSNPDRNKKCPNCGKKQSIFQPDQSHAFFCDRCRHPLFWDAVDLKIEADTDRARKAHKKWAGKKKRWD